MLCVITPALDLRVILNSKYGPQTTVYFCDVRVTADERNKWILAQRTNKYIVKQVGETPKRV